MERFQHYLVESVNEITSTFSAYSLDQDAQVKLNQKVSLSPAMVRIECDLYQIKPAQALKIAEEKLATKWKCPEYFVTAMKCGIEHSFDDGTSFVLERNFETSFSLLTPDLEVEEGNHLMIRDYRNPEFSHSVLVLSCPDHTNVSIKPQVDSVDVIDLTLYPEVYRVDYSDALPTSETLIRGKSQVGDTILKSYPNDHSHFVTWAKTGVTKQVSIPVDTKHSRCYEKVTSYDKIQIGDHLLQHLIMNSSPSQRHLMITEHIRDWKFKVIYFKQGSIQEETEEIQGEYYIIKYQKELLLPSQDAVKRGRAQIGPKYNPWDRMLFIMQAKLAESVSPQGASTVDGKSVLMSKQQLSAGHCSLPVSKSRIMCFKQVISGDYIIKVPNNPLTKRNTSASHHYLIVSSDNSPTQCTVIESHSGKVVKSTCTIKPSTDSVERNPFFYYRINYEPGMCISSTDSVKRANEMIGERTSIGNDKFVPYMKVGDQVAVSVSKLPDERDHIQQVKLSSANRIPFLGQPLYSLPVTSCNQISLGTHILYKHGNAFPPLYHSAIVVDIMSQQSHDQTYPNDEVLDVITNTLCSGYIRQSLIFSQLQSISKVVYLSGNFSEEEIIMRAKNHLQYHENFYHPDYYNSHHFATMCTTGYEYSLTGVLVRKQIEDNEGIAVDL